MKYASRTMISTVRNYYACVSDFLSAISDLSKFIVNPLSLEPFELIADHQFPGHVFKKKTIFF